MCKKIRVIVDADDVLLNCNGYALQLLSEEENKSYSMTDITGWGNLGTEVDKRLKYFESRYFFETQPPLPGSAAFLKELMEIADVTIMSAVNPVYSGTRMQRLTELYPFFPTSYIVIGERKDMMKADVLLDDRIKNVLSSKCELPVLFRQPWNHKISGVCSVGRYDDFISIVKTMKNGADRYRKGPAIVCIVGPSGSNKHLIFDRLCEEPDFEPLAHVSTDTGYDRITVPQENFRRYSAGGAFAEETWYDGHRYATLSKDVENVLEKGKNAISVLDISGSLTLARKYPGRCLIVFASRSKYESIKAVLSKNLTNQQKADRIFSYDLEQKNKLLADMEVSTRESEIEKSVKRILTVARNPYRPGV